MSPILPLPLLLLVHLYILQYPHANDAEYDHDLFNPRTRGLRYRTRTMEDIAYFLVGRLEGKGIKSILSTYPCRQPSESLAFRTSLTKYLEQLRHQAIYPSRSDGDASNSVDKILAFWWKDVMVRRSLLEECAGDKFERLILSLSTHVLMKALDPIPLDIMSTRLRSQPLLYSAAIARYNSVRLSWSSSALLLLQWENDLKILRVRLQSHSQSRSTKYDGLPTARLKSLAQSKLEDLANLHWTNNKTSSSLSAFLELSGLRLLSNDSGKRFLPSSQGLTENTLPVIQPPPLPIAAAHHPSYLKKLRCPVLQSHKSTGSVDTPTISLPTKTHAEIIFAVQIDSAKRMQQLLADALSRSKKHQNTLRHAVDSKSSQTKLNDATPFWHFPSNSFEICYNPDPTKDLLTLAGFEKDFAILHPDTESEVDNQLEKRIAEIRSNVLAPFPLPPNLADPRLPSRETALPVSRIPQPKSMVAATTKQTTMVALDSRQEQRPPDPLGKSPASARRKSVRFSTARRRTGRSSMFRLLNDLDDDVDLLVDQTHDFPTDDDDTDYEGGPSNTAASMSIHKTPKAKRKTPKVNRIWTAGTPSSKMKKILPRPRSSEFNALTELLDAEPLLELPTLGSSTSSLQLFSEDSPRLVEDEEACERAEDVDATPMPKRRNTRTAVYSSISKEKVASNGAFCAEEEDDFLVDDPPSMTLKELLLSADTGQFDLLGKDDNDEMQDTDFFGEDGSFAWE